MYYLLRLLMGTTLGLSLLMGCVHSFRSIAQESSQKPSQEFLPETPRSSTGETLVSLRTVQDLHDLAVSSTVRIFSVKNGIPAGGSGVIVDRNETYHIVLTNQHVIAEADRAYQIEAHDGQIYTAHILDIPRSPTESQPPEDVGFILFESAEQPYEVLPLRQANHPLQRGQMVFAGGFPFTEQLTQSEEFNFTEGKVVEVLEQPFIGGYKVGYTNVVTPGMSGGPVLNQYGELVGINGLRSNPLFSNSYIYEDGTLVPPNQLEALRKLSWAVPLETTLRLFEAVQSADLPTDSQPSH